MLKTAEELLMWFENAFDCMEGPPRACFSVPNSANTSYRFTYTVYALGTKTSIDPEAALVNAMFDAFYPISCLPIEKQLFWRRRPEFKQEEVQVLGEIYATREDVQDNRVTLPRDAVEDFETGTWRQDCGKELLSKLTMRLVIPALNWCPQKIEFARREDEHFQLLENLK